MRIVSLGILGPYCNDTRSQSIEAYHDLDEAERTVRRPRMILPLPCGGRMVSLTQHAGTATVTHT